MYLTPSEVAHNGAATLAPGQPSREDAQRATSSGGRPFFFLLAVLLLVNTGGVWGQGGWFYSHTPAGWDVPFRIGMAGALALALEMIGVYLSQEAHLARLADQPSLVLQLGAYAVGGVAGWMNYSHWIDTPDGQSLAIIFALLSGISPWLWAIYSKARNRQRLEEAGQGTRRGVRLSAARKLWHPIKSVRVMSFASWEGITGEDDAVRRWELMRTPAEEIPVSPAPAGKKTKAEWWADAQAVWAKHPTATQKIVAEQIGCSPRWLRECEKEVTTNA